MTRLHVFVNRAKNYNMPTTQRGKWDVLVPYLPPENYNLFLPGGCDNTVVVPYLTPENYNLCALTPCFTGGFLCFFIEKVGKLKE